MMGFFIFAWKWKKFHHFACFQSVFYVMESCFSSSLGLFMRLAELVQLPVSKYAQFVGFNVLFRFLFLIGFCFSGFVNVLVLSIYGWELKFPFWELGNWIFWWFIYSEFRMAKTSHGSISLVCLFTLLLVKFQTWPTQSLSLSTPFFYFFILKICLCLFDYSVCWYRLFYYAFKGCAWITSQNLALKRVFAYDFSILLQNHSKESLVMIFYSTQNLKFFSFCANR